MFRILLARLVATAVSIILLLGCAAGPTDRVSYAFDLLIDNSLDHATEIRYSYGELGEHHKAIARSNGNSIIFMRMDMIIPANFEISWITPDGKQHRKDVPVRSRIKGSIKGKSVLFLILYDDVQGYISQNTPKGEVRERFY